MKSIIEKNLLSINSSLDINIKNDRFNGERTINSGIFKNVAKGNNGCKISYGFDISALNLREVTALKLFNLWFGDVRDGLARNIFSNWGSFSFEFHT